VATLIVNFVVGAEELANGIVNTVAPNPTTEKFMLTYSNAAVNSISIAITNIAGQEVYSEQVEQFNGSYKKEINLTGNANGVYFIKIMAGETAYMHKLILNQ
jgi:hypothetical protein